MNNEQEKPNAVPNEYTIVHRFLWRFMQKHGIDLKIEGDCSNEYILEKLIKQGFPKPKVADKSGWPASCSNCQSSPESCCMSECPNY